MIDHELLAMIIEEHHREGLEITEAELMVWHAAITDAYTQVTGKSAFAPDVMTRSIN